MTDLPTFRQCLGAMVDRRYEECVRCAHELLDAGAGHEILQILLISLQRLGRNDELEQIKQQALDVTQTRPWFHALVRLTVGQTDPGEVMAEANDSTQRCQAHYYTAARLVTAGQTDEADEHLDACLALESPCVERQLAEASRRRMRMSNGHKKVSASQLAAAVRQCVDLFLASDYEAVVAQVQELAAASAIRCDLPQLLLISLQRLGRDDQIGRLGQQMLEATAGHRWFHRLLQLTLGQAEPADVLAEADGDDQRCQAHYYHGARLLTLGHPDEARAEFEACLRVKSACPEYALASVERLCPLLGPASPGQQRRQPGADRAD